MSITAQVAYVSAAVFAKERFSNPDARRDFCDRVRALATEGPPQTPVLTLGTLSSGLGDGTDEVSVAFSDWVSNALRPVVERFTPNLVGWNLYDQPIVSEISMKPEELDRRVVEALIQLSNRPESIAECRRAVVELLPAGVLGPINLFRAGVVPSSALYLRGFVDINALPALHLGVGTLLGAPFTETNESAELIQHVRPRPELAISQTSASSTVPLLEHVENVGTGRVPDWVGIACVKNVERAETTILHPIQAMYSMVRAGLLSEVACLFDDKFWVRNPESFGDSREKRQGIRVFLGNAEHPGVQADFADMGSDSKPHAEAFEAFKAHCGLVRTKICLQPGEMLFLRNTAGSPPTLHQQCMHGRGAFQAAPVPGEERHLLRVFIREEDDHRSASSLIGDPIYL